MDGQVNWKKLYLDWLKEKVDESEHQGRGFMRTQTTFSRAYKSLEACDKNYQHPKELLELKYFGPKVCDLLEKKLNLYCAAHGLQIPENPEAAAATVSFLSPSTTESKSKSKSMKVAAAGEASGSTSRQKPTKIYVPKHRSGGYAILITLLLDEKSGKGRGMTKNEITKVAKLYCDSPFENNPSTNMYYAAWNSIKTLLNHDLVYASSSRNATYQLTDLGREISERLFQLHNESENQVSAAATESSVSQNQWRSPPSSPQRATISTILSQALQRAPSSTTAASPVTPKTSEDRLYKVTTWPVGSYRIKIVFDNREVKSTNDRRFFEMEVLNYGVASEVKSLAVGDVVWIAEHKRTEQQVVIDYIAERKRLDDLISSIKDGRFSEQKFRLHRSSLKNIIYLVEESLVMEVTAAFKKAVHTAMSQAIIVDGFFLKRTLSAEETAKYLANVTQYLEFLYKDRALTVIKPDVSNYKQAMTKAREMFNKYHIGIDYEAFATAMSKTGMLTVRDVFIKMLMTIRGVTWDKAVTVQKLYKTPYFLCQAYREMNDEQKRKTLLSDQTASLIARKKITKVISERIYETWGELINQP